MHRGRRRLDPAFGAVGAVAVAAVTIFTMAVAIAVDVALLDALQARELLALGERDQGHALSGAAHYADLRHRGADEDTAGGDEHDLVLLLDQHGADDAPVAL